VEEWNGPLGLRISFLLYSPTPALPHSHLGLPAIPGAPRMTAERHSTLWNPQVNLVEVRPARWIVCERTGRWSVGLRREAPAGLRIHETRSLPDGWEMLRQHPASFLVVELTAANADALLGRLASMARDFPAARAAVVAERPLADHEWLVRELGATWFAVSSRELAPVVKLARRHLERAPSPPSDILEQIWNSLPWGTFSTCGTR
jgi:hypothetical protein